MKDRIDAILKRSQAEYLESLTPSRDALLARMEEFAAERRHPIADPEVAPGKPIFYSYAFSQISATEKSLSVDRFSFSKRGPLDLAGFTAITSRPDTAY